VKTKPPKDHRWIQAQCCYPSFGAFTFPVANAKRALRRKEQQWWRSALSRFPPAERRRYPSCR